MRCPKCHYISFEGGDRCRNCGYEFSLSVDAGTLDLPIQTGNEPLGPLADFSLGDLDAPGADDPAPNVPIVDAEPVRTDADLPLFDDSGGHDDRPLVSSAAAPRPPLAVRRSSPVIQRAPQRRVASDEPSLDLALEESTPAPAPPLRAIEPVAGAADTPGAAAPAGARLLGGLIDAVIMGSIDALVLYLTLRLCGLTFAEIAILPPVPFVGFLLMLNGGYVVVFTAAGGQTIGKMAASTRVVPAGENALSDRVPLSQAIVRTLAYLVSLLPFGAGFLPALFGTERRALHDRLAGTRVVSV